jgi:hypothetical protein
VEKMAVNTSGFLVKGLGAEGVYNTANLQNQNIKRTPLGPVIMVIGIDKNGRVLKPSKPPVVAQPNNNNAQQVRTTESQTANNQQRPPAIYVVGQNGEKTEITPANNQPVILNISNSAIYIYNITNSQTANGNTNSVVGNNNQLGIPNGVNPVVNPGVNTGLNNTPNVSNPNPVEILFKNPTILGLGFAAEVGAIKHNPAQFAIYRIAKDRNFVESFLNAISDRLQKLNVYERYNEKAGYFYQGINAKAENLRLNQYIRNDKTAVRYNLNISLQETRVGEYIYVDKRNNRVNYSLNVTTPEFNLREYFNGVKTDYSYSFNFERKNGTNSLSFNTIGSARKVGDKYILTPNAYNQRGAIWSNQKVDLTKNFEITAKVYLGNRPQGADGITFTIQNSPQGRNALGGGGGGLGYAGISNSVAVELDTWQNRSIGDINGNHVGINVNGSVKSQIQASLSGSLENGKETTLRVKWEYLGNNRAKLTVELPEHHTRISQTINNITEIFGGTKAYIGFTGATGGERNYQYVRNIQFKQENNTNPINAYFPLVMAPNRQAEAGFIGALKNFLNRAV